MPSPSVAPGPDARPVRRRLRLLALIGAAYLGLGIWAPAGSLHVTGGTANDLRLDFPIEYLLLAPVTRILDELSLLDDRQHLAVLWTLAALAVLVAARRGSRAVDWRARARAGGRAALMTLVAGMAVYLGGALVPRPMAALVSTDADVLLVDFHSHTERSHDGRWRFSAESNREWHGAAGFHAAYVTDHQTMEAWQLLAASGQLSPPPSPVREAAIVGGAPRVGATTLLPGIETVVPGAHLNLLGVEAAHLPMFHHRRDLDTAVFAAWPMETRPFTLLTLPFNIERAPQRPPRIDAIELTTGAPKGRRFAREHRARIVALADSMGVPLVASSNLHGWGSTAVAWTAVHLPGWQQLSPLALDAAIRSSLGDRPGAVRVAERASLAPATSWVAHLATVPRLAWHTAGAATVPERAVVLVWVGAFLVLGQRRSRRA